MFINLKYSGYNRHGEQSSAGLFLILMQPKNDTPEYPEYETLCAKCGKGKDAHQTSIPYVLPCPDHGIIARLKARRDGTEAELDAICADGERFVSECEACQRLKEYLSNCFTFSPARISYPLRAIVRYVRMRQVGHWMMGSARIGSHRITLSGSYGSDGLPTTVPDSVYKLGVPLPQELYDAWSNGGGWNCAGSEAEAMRKWALSALVPPKGFHVAGAGYAREYRSLASAQRAFERLRDTYEGCSVVTDQTCFRLLIGHKR